MLTKLTALFIAVYLFFAGLIYGNEPIKIEVVSSPFDNDVIDCISGSRCTLGFTCKNIGRPFQGESDYTPLISIFRNIDNKRQEIRIQSFLCAESISQPILIKHNALLYGEARFEVPKDTEEGLYSVSVRFYKAEEIIYQNAIFIEKGE